MPGTTSLGFTEVEAQLPGRTERYMLPMGVIWEDEMSGALAQQLALTRVRKGPRVGYLTDAFALDGLTHGMLTGLRESSVIPIDEGGERLEFRPTSRMGSLELPAEFEIRRLSAEQSNSSWIVGDTLVMKLVRRVLAGVHPEGEMTRVLTERGFGNTAPLFGELVRVDADGTPHTVALAQGFVRNQGDGWTWTLDYLARTVEEVALTTARPRAPPTSKRMPTRSTPTRCSPAPSARGWPRCTRCCRSRPTTRPSRRRRPTRRCSTPGPTARSSRSTWRWTCWPRQRTSTRPPVRRRRCCSSHRDALREAARSLGAAGRRVAADPGARRLPPGPGAGRAR